MPQKKLNIFRTYAKITKNHTCLHFFNISLTWNHFSNRVQQKSPRYLAKISTLHTSTLKLWDVWNWNWHPDRQALSLKISLNNRPPALVLICSHLWTGFPPGDLAYKKLNYTTYKLSNRKKNNIQYAHLIFFYNTDTNIKIRN